MTRINVVPVEELTNKHLMGEYHEITRVFGLVKKAKARKINKYNFHEKVNPPTEYTLGTGHVKFFYDKLGFILKRYHRLGDELASRGYNVQPLSENALTEGLDAFWMGSYEPTPEALKINRERIQERLK